MTLMKEQTISKTFRVIPESIIIINTFAKEQDLGLSEALNKLIHIAEKYLKERQLEEELDELTKDKQWMKINREWAEMKLD